MQCDKRVHMYDFTILYYKQMYRNYDCIDVFEAIRNVGKYFSIMCVNV